MVFGPQGTPGCLSASTPWFVNNVFNVIIAIATTSGLTLTMLPVFLLPPQLYGGDSFRRRTSHCKEDIDAGKYPIATTIANLLIIAYIILLVDNTEKGRPLPSTFQWQYFYQDCMKTLAEVHQVPCCASIYSTSRSAPRQHPIAGSPPLLPILSSSLRTLKTEDPCPLLSNGDIFIKIA
jgi:hypothetical protein